MRASYWDEVTGIISIHVLRVEDDLVGKQGADFALGISIHVLRVEDDPSFGCLTCIFFISIHVLRVEDDLFGAAAGCGCVAISIHVLRVEDDSKNREKSLFVFI